MKLQEFNNQLAKLNEAYRDYYTKNRAKVIWSVVEHLPIEYFSRRVDRALWADHPPKIDWFQNVRNDYEKSQEPQRSEEASHPKDLSRLNVSEMLSAFRRGRIF